MRVEMIESYTQQLAVSLGGIRPPLGQRKTAELRALYEQKDFAGMVRHIKTNLRLDLRMRICLVDKGGPPQAPAWVGFPFPMPFYGTRAFQKILATVYIRKAFLTNYPFETVVAAMAHELSHLVLAAIDHPLVDKEEAADLTAMMLGYRNFFRTGGHIRNVVRKPVEGSFLRRMAGRLDELLFGKQTIIATTHSVGYLESNEVTFAADAMDGRCMREQSKSRS